LFHPGVAKEAFRRVGSGAADLVLGGWSANRTLRLGTDSRDPPGTM